MSTKPFVRTIGAWVALLFLASLLAGCGETSGDATEPPISASPSHASMFGEIGVTLTGNFSDLGEIQSVMFNGIKAAHDR